MSRTLANTSRPGKVLLNEIVERLSPSFNLSTLLREAPDSETVGGGNFCDVKCSQIPWKAVEDRKMLLLRCLAAGISPVDESGANCMKVAVKRARAHLLNSLSPDKREKFTKRYAREIQIWSTLEHANILRFLGYADEDHTFPSLISAWMENSTAKQYLEKNSNLTTKLSLIIDVTEGLVYLHSENIIHGDLKAENVLVSQSGKAMLADFGISRVLMLDDFSVLKTSSNNVSGTLRWMAAEQLTLTHDRYSKATDVWSFGMTVYEFLTGKTPFEHLKSEPLVINAIMRCELPHQPGEPLLRLEPEKRLWTTCQLCWYETPILRPTIHDLRNIIRAQVEIPKEATPTRMRDVENANEGPDENHIPLLNRVEFLAILDESSKGHENLSEKQQASGSGQKVDLYNLYVDVARLGGYTTVCHHELWGNIAAKLDREPSSARILQPLQPKHPTSHECRTIYDTYLLPFERQLIPSSAKSSELHQDAKECLSPTLQGALLEVIAANNVELPNVPRFITSPKRNSLKRRNAASAPNSPCKKRIVHITFDAEGS